MDTYLWIFISIVGFSIIVQSILTWLFIRALAQPSPELLSDAQCPKASVILCLRGGDPFLKVCLESVLKLDYPDFEFIIVADNTEDPALKFVNEVINQTGTSNIRIEILKTPLESCSLKCSGLIQAVEVMDPNSEIYAQLDADTIVHPMWLRELATALTDPQVGVATGNRWYIPEDKTYPNLVRSIWNAAAIVQMYCHDIAWGGTIAMRREVIEKANLKHFWSRSFGDDTFMYSVMKPHGLKVKFVPTLLMVNRESCNMSGYFHWCSRQLINTRLCHPKFPLVVLHGISTALIQLIGLGWIALSCYTQDWLPFYALIASLVVYQSMNVVLLSSLEYSVQKLLNKRGDSIQWLQWSDLLKVLLSIPITQTVYTGSLIFSIFMRKVHWRGVTYQVKGPWNLRLEEYIPYKEQNTNSDKQHSL